jgi:DNA invertase Pin-like site-specific DNA recombinase
MSEKITPDHLERSAYVYVRQSTMHPVREHRESQRRQYALADRARKLGFRDVVVVDDDLGRSGSGSVERRGFARLLEAVCSGSVGAVLALEASRLARNNRDWHHLIDLCTLTDTLVVDHDGVYHPRQLNDRLLLGLKGTMSEFELGLLRQRAQEALRGMIHRGEVLWEVPIGYERSGDNRCEMSPDRQVQDAIRGIFAKFRELGSARQVLLWYRQQKLPLPTRQLGPDGGVRWKIPGYPRILSILQNPVYAGAFAYGRTRTKTVVNQGKARKTAGHAVGRDDWQVLLRDHHAAYISWDEYLRNQEQLASNAAMRGLMTQQGAAKKGSALLAGLLRCGRCGRKLHVGYSGVGGRVARYHCKGGQLNHGVKWCISFGGVRVDEAVSAVVLEAVRPLGVQAAFDAWEERARQDDEKRRALTLALQKAEYEVDRARRQYDAVEPENRLVAAELEARWNDALAQVAELNSRLEECEGQEQTPSDAERQRLLELGEDLDALWNHPEASVALKKRILRTLLEEIVVDLREDPPEIVLQLHWVGGVHSPLVVKKPQRGDRRGKTDRTVVELVGELAKVCPDPAIARILNRLGYRTGPGNTWTEGRVRSLRAYQKIPAFDPSAPRTSATLAEAAERLGVSASVVRRLLERGILVGSQVVTHAPWSIPQEALDAPAVQQAVRAIREGRPAPRTLPGQNEMPFNSTT